jgi:uncharacterized protein YciI
LLFVVTRHDMADSVDLRLRARPKHLEYLATVMPCIMGGGALLNSRQEQIGSMLIIDVPDRHAAEAFAAADPFVAAGLFASTTIDAYRPVFLNGARIDG